MLPSTCPVRTPLSSQNTSDRQTPMNLSLKLYRNQLPKLYQLSFPGVPLTGTKLTWCAPAPGIARSHALVGFHDLGQLVVPLVGQDGREQGPVVAVVAGIVQAGDRGDVDVAGRIDLLVAGQLAGELVRAPDGREGQAGLLVLGRPGEPADVTPEVSLVDPPVPAVDRTVVEVELVRDVECGHHAHVGERLAVVEHVRHREEWSPGRRHHFIAGQGVPPAPLDVEASLGEEGEVDLAVELGHVVAGELSRA